MKSLIVCVCYCVGSLAFFVGSLLNCLLPDDSS